MNNKNIIIAVSVVAVVAVIAYFFLQNPKSTTNKVTQIVEDVVDIQDTEVKDLFSEDAGNVDADSAVAKISNSAFLVVSLSTDKMNNATTAVSAFVDSLKTTAVWKKLNLDAQLEQILSGGMQPGMPNSAELELAKSQLQSIWENLSEITLAAADGGVQLSEAFTMPQIVLNSRFSDSSLSDHIKQQLDQGLMAGQDKVVTPEFEISKESDDLYKFVIIDVDSQARIPGSININEKSGQITLGVEESTNVFADSEDSLLIKSEKWKKVAKPITPKSAIMVFADSQAIYKYMAAVEKYAAEISAKAEGGSISGDTVELFNQQGLLGIQNFVFAAELDKGVWSGTCTELDSESNTTKLYQKIFEKRNQQEYRFHKIPGEGTIVAVKLLFDAFPLYIDQARRTYIPALEADPSSAKDAQELAKLLDDVEATVERFGFTELGLVANAPIAGAIPEAGVYLGGSNYKGRELVEQFAKSVNSLSSGMSSDQQDLIQISGVDADSVPKMIIQAGAMPIVGQVVGENSLVFSSSPNVISTVEERLNADQADLEKRVAKLRYGASNVSRSEHFIYLNSDKAFQMLRPMFFFAAQQAPELTPQDIEEATSKLSTTIISSSISKLENGNVVCAGGLINTIQ